jgi:hypothetical protein
MQYLYNIFFDNRRSFETSLKVNVEYFYKDLCHEYKLASFLHFDISINGYEVNGLNRQYGFSTRRCSGSGIEANKYLFDKISEINHLIKCIQNKDVNEGYEIKLFRDVSRGSIILSYRYGTFLAGFSTYNKFHQLCRLDNLSDKEKENIISELNKIKNEISKHIKHEKTIMEETLNKTDSNLKENVLLVLPKPHLNDEIINKSINYRKYYYYNTDSR